MARVIDFSFAPFAKILVSASALSIAASGGFAQETYNYYDIDPANFNNSTTIDNQWWPLTPGMQFTYEGSTVEDDVLTPHTIIFTVTDLVKKINGIDTVVIFDSDYVDGVVEELELAFFAQDDDGNVWHLGQYSEVYSEDELVGGRIFAVGHVEGARAGIMMKASPEVDEASYSQGYGPEPFNWWDRARTAEIGASTTVAAGTFDDVLISEEFNEDEPDAIQLKYYAKGIGNVRIGWTGADELQETMELIKYEQLDAERLAVVRQVALGLESRGYIYGTTSPAMVRK